MSLTVAVQMDPIQHIKIAGDSTFALLLEAQRRGHALLHYTPDRLAMRDGRVEARVEPFGIFASGPPSGGEPVYSYDAVRMPVRLAESCEPADRELAEMVREVN